jgi:hypothetical protein
MAPGRRCVALAKIATAPGGCACGVIFLFERRNRRPVVPATSQVGVAPRDLCSTGVALTYVSVWDQPFLEAIQAQGGEALKPALLPIYER